MMMIRVAKDGISPDVAGFPLRKNACLKHVFLLVYRRLQMSSFV